MLTIDEVAAVPLFSALPAAELERLARTSADLQLGPENSPFPKAASARCSPCSRARSRSSRRSTASNAGSAGGLPGTIFGEVPIALGTPFPGGYRAVGTVARDAGRCAAVLRDRGRIARTSR